MNTNRLIRIPILTLLIVALMLLAVGGLAVVISLVWPLIHIPRNPSPIQADPLKLVDAFHSAINQDNVDTVLTLFSEDATIIDGVSTVRGKEQIRDWVLHSERMAGLRLTLIYSQVSGEKVFWQDLANNEPDVQDKSYILRWMAVIQEGKIQSLTVSLLPMPDGK